MIRISGYSDDLIEVERIRDGKVDLEEEFNCFEHDMFFKFDDGTQLRMTYKGGTWRAIIEIKGTAKSTVVPLWNGDDYYSDCATIETDIIQAHWKE